MPGKLKAGDTLPLFHYDTPYSRQNDFGALLQAGAPLVLVLMGNFGHPITRVFAQRYARTYGALKTGSCALVVRSQAEKLARGVRQGMLPYELLCDARGVLYKHFDIPQRSGVAAYSLEAWQIMHDARRRGYQAQKQALHQLPLTLVLAADGTVLFSHYGTTLTDVPADCAAMQQLLDTLAEGAPAPVKEYAQPEELEKTFVDGIFSDPYSGD